MTASHAPPLSPRPLLRSIRRGFIGRCPACGRGAILVNYLAPCAKCASCGEAFAEYQAADFAPYIVTFFVGMVFTPLTVVVAMSRDPNNALLWVMMGAAVLSALVLLPRVKGAAIAMLWALDIHNA